MMLRLAEQLADRLEALRLCPGHRATLVDDGYAEVEEGTAAVRNAEQAALWLEVLIEQVDLGPQAEPLQLATQEVEVILQGVGAVACLKQYLSLQLLEGVGVLGVEGDDEQREGDRGSGRIDAHRGAPKPQVGVG
jgi:hypothetical protein